MILRHKFPDPLALVASTSDRLESGRIPWMEEPLHYPIWVIVRVMVPFWVPIIIRHLIVRVPEKGP